MQCISSGFTEKVDPFDRSSEKWIYQLCTNWLVYHKFAKFWVNPGFELFSNMYMFRLSFVN